jgi:hypothetical protein
MRMGFPKDWSAWLDNVDRACSHGDRRWTDDRGVGLLATTQELAAWGSLEWDKAKRRSWEDLLGDWVDARSTAGPVLSLAVTTRLEAVDAAVTTCQGELKATKEISTDVRTRLADAASRLEIKLRTPHVAAAAWNDLVETLQEPHPMQIHQRITELRDLFWDLLTLQGWGVGFFGLGGQISRILGGDSFAIKEAVTALPRDLAENYAGPEIARTDLSPERRVALVRDVIASSDSRSSNTVWLAYDRANIRTWPIATAASIEIYESGWIMPNLRGDGPFFEKLPDELRGSADHLGTVGPPEDPGTVLIRIQLEDAPSQRAVQQATEYMENILGFVWSFERSEWRQLMGYWHFVDGALGVHSGFSEPIDISNETWRNLDLTGPLLKMATTLAGFHPPLDKKLETLVGVSKAIEKAKTAPASSRVLLHVYAVESVSQHLDLPWVDFATEIGCPVMCAHSLRVSILSAVRRLASFRPWHTATSDSIAYERLRDEVVRDLYGGREDTLRWDNVEKLAETARHHTGPDTLVQLDARFLAEVRHGYDPARRLALLKQTHVSSVDRLRRIRNSAQHGPAVHESAASRLIDISASLANWALRVSTTALLTGGTAEEALRADSARAQDELERLAAGGLFRHA